MNILSYTQLSCIQIMKYLSFLYFFIQDKCFTFLRTINKLGYVVLCLDVDSENIGSFQVLVQSEAFDGEYVYKKITEFLEHHVPGAVFNRTKSPKDSQLTDQVTQFIEAKKADLKSVLEQKDSTLNKRTSRLWHKIRHGQLTFGLLEQQLQLLYRINATTVMNFYHEHVLNPATYHKMIIVVNGKGRNFHPDVTYPLDYAQLPEYYPAQH